MKYTPLFSASAEKRGVLFLGATAIIPMLSRGILMVSDVEVSAALRILFDKGKGN